MELSHSHHQVRLTRHFLGVVCLPPQRLYLLSESGVTLLLDFCHLHDYDVHAVGEGLVVALIQLPTLLHHLLQVVLVGLLLHHFHHSFLVPLELLFLDQQVVVLLVLLLDVLLQLFYDVRHLLLVSSLFRFELPYQPAHLVALLLLQ